MKNPTLKRIILPTLVIAFILVGFYFFNRGEEVYLRIVEPEYGPELNADLQNLIESEKANVGIFTYAFSGDGVYELLLVDNRILDKNLYLNTEISARMYGDVLKIKIIDNDAVSEGDIAYNQKAYLILKSKPTKIETYVNGELYVVVMEESQSQIVK